MNASRRLAVVCLHTCPWQRPGEENVGGMNIYVRQTAALLAAHGWAVDIFTRLHAGTAHCSNSTPGVQLFHVPAGPIGTCKDDLHHWLKSFIAGVLNVERAAAGQQGPAGSQRRADSQYHAVLSHYWLSGLAAIELAKHWRVPHLAGFHTLALAKQAAFPAGIELAVRVQGERRVVQHADRLLAVSQHERGVLTEMYDVDPDAISIASPGIDPERFHPQSRQKARNQLGLSLHDRILLAVGRTTPIKGFDVLLEALARISDPNVSVLFVGGSLDSVSHRNMQAHARRLQVGHRVRFVGSVDHDLLPAYYAACDACVVPSLYESFGLVALESIGCGRPVVASRVGGLQSIVVDNSLGILVTPGSVIELAQALERVLGELQTVSGKMPATSVLPSWSTTADAISAALKELDG